MCELTTISTFREHRSQSASLGFVLSPGVLHEVTAPTSADTAPLSSSPRHTRWRNFHPQLVKKIKHSYHVKMSILSEHNLFNYTNVPSLAGLAGSKVINTSLDGNLKCIRSFAR